ncbi:hypothetical protein BN2497_5719 [Janthinobacterium sp. CG23_2]|nr:hypothetical protein BN2497_5719 [Janthinobacterium sp. CG23_2]CUU29257.1 hypothetical protein BN3177_5719 [Janthinobacterium sp. CG23_2]
MPDPEVLPSFEPRHHRCYLRSRIPERVGKSPAQLMTGQAHPHWLTLLNLGPLQPQRA